jgi:hypothetical protein
VRLREWPQDQALLRRRVSGYASLSAAMGSTRLARLAGSQQAARATAVSTSAQMAKVRGSIVASDWVDYLHLARWQGRWVIVNVLWEKNAPEEPKK